MRFKAKTGTHGGRVRARSVLGARSVDQRLVGLDVQSQIETGQIYFLIVRAHANARRGHLAIKLILLQRDDGGREDGEERASDQHVGTHFVKRFPGECVRNLLAAEDENTQYLIIRRQSLRNGGALRLNNSRRMA